MKKLRITAAALVTVATLSVSTPAMAKETTGFDLTAWFAQIFTTRSGTGKPIKPNQ